MDAPTQVAWFAALGETLPPNVRLVMPDDPLSSYDLMDAADVGITYGSTAGLEMMMLGKPLVTAPPLPSYAYVPGVLLVTETAALEATLDTALRTTPSRDFRRGAFRFLYRYYFEMQQPFPLVTMVGLNESQRNYQSLDALAPGRDAALDRLCGFLLRGESIYPVPTPEDRQRTTEDENRYFSGLERDASWLGDGWQSRTQAVQRALRRAWSLAALLTGRLVPASIRHRVWEALPPKVRGTIR